MVYVGPVRNGIKVRLKLLLGYEILRMGGVGSKVICVRSKVNIGRRSGDVKSVKIEELGRGHCLVGRQFWK